MALSTSSGAAASATSSRAVSVHEPALPSYLTLSTTSCGEQTAWHTGNAGSAREHGGNGGFGAAGPGPPAPPPSVVRVISLRPSGRVKNTLQQTLWVKQVASDDPARSHHQSHGQHPGQQQSHPSECPPPVVAEVPRNGGCLDTSWELPKAADGIALLGHQRQAESSSSSGSGSSSSGSSSSSGGGGSSSGSGGGGSLPLSFGVLF